MTLAPGPSRDGVAQMFDRIAPRYDFLNRTLSFGMDKGWRKRVVKNLPDGDDLQVLDVATGTGDLLFAMSQHARVSNAVGVDVSGEMLAHAREKAAARSFPAEISFVEGNAQKLEGYASQFDAVTIAFGIRNVKDTVLGLQQMTAALKPGGRMLVLEFSTPSGKLFGPIYEAYRSIVLPRVGGVVSGDSHAYRYLDETIKTFPDKEAFMSLMTQAGMVDLRREEMGGGAVSLYVGHAPEVVDELASQKVDPK